MNESFLLSSSRTLGIIYFSYFFPMSLYLSNFEVHQNWMQASPKSISVNSACFNRQELAYQGHLRGTGDCLASCSLIHQGLECPQVCYVLPLPSTWLGAYGNIYIGDTRAGVPWPETGWCHQLLCCTNKCPHSRFRGPTQADSPTLLESY